MSVGFSDRPNLYWPPNHYWFLADHQLLEMVAPPEDAMKLKELGDAIPSLLVAAVYHCTRHYIAGTIMSCWILCEAIIAGTSNTYVRQIANGKRRARLGDYRAYSASVQLEVLLAAGVISSALYDALNAARKVRNDLAHIGKMDNQSAGICVDAMRLTIEFVGAASSRLPRLNLSGRGGGLPDSTLEPSFPLRIADLDQ